MKKQKTAQHRICPSCGGVGQAKGTRSIENVGSPGKTERRSKTYYYCTACPHSWATVGVHVIVHPNR